MINVPTLLALVDGPLAGLFIGSSMVEQSARRLSAPQWIAYKHAKEAVFGPVMPLVFNVCLLATAAAAIFTRSHWAFGAAAALLAAVMVITIKVHLPLNSQFGTWAGDAYPTSWDAGRARWRDWNLARAALVIAAFLCVLAARASRHR